MHSSGCTCFELRGMGSIIAGIATSANLPSLPRKLCNLSEMPMLEQVYVSHLQENSSGMYRDHESYVKKQFSTLFYWSKSILS